MGHVPTKPGSRVESPAFLEVWVPIKEKDKRRKYAREWVAKRRWEFFKDKSCVRCGAAETGELCLHHRDKATKVGHNIWSWSKARREAEIAKCVVVCGSCHMQIHVEMAHRARPHGYSSTYKSGCRCIACTKAQRYARTGGKTLVCYQCLCVVESGKEVRVDDGERVQVRCERCAT